MPEEKKLDLILSELKGIRTDVSGLKEDVSGLKEDVSGLKENVSRLEKDVFGLKQDVSGLKQDVLGLKQDVSGIRLHQENVTDKNISILAENHINLVKKLNEAIPYANNNKVYEIQVRCLTERVCNLERDFAEFKSKSA